MSGAGPAPTAVRIDSWLWAVRVYRTRSLAAEACRAGHVRIGGERAKPSSPVRVGAEVRARTGDRERVLSVTALRVKRVGAGIAAECYLDLTPPAPREEAEPLIAARERGAGRPTKRDRREIDRFRGR